jgi:alpha-glucosidase
MDPQWYRHAVIYQVYPRSFADSNGDGIGDLPGLTARLPYLASLGIDALWLSPFYRSPMADGGYDVADYRDVDPMFGTLADFDAFLSSAHALGLRVIVDIVPNHSSSAHPWFVSAMQAAPGSPERERYIFLDGTGPSGELPPNDWESVFGGRAWTRVPDGQWYLHLFDPSQPDFNWRNFEVREEFASILRFWLDRGVDGFRVDVAHGMIKASGFPDCGYTNQIRLLGGADLPYFDQDEVHEIYREWRKILDSYPGERIAVAEAWASSVARLARYVSGDELHQAFNFDFLTADWSSASIKSIVDASLAGNALVGAPTTWVLSNHDKPRHVTRYGDGVLGQQRARAATLLMLALPGSAYLYQGEELGLAEVLDLPPQARQDPVWFRSGGTEPGRDGCRVPLPWSGDAPPYGFSASGSWLPQPSHWASLTVSAQAGDPDSMLSLYREALRLRRSHAALGASGSAELRWLDTPDGVLAFSRVPGFVCATNFTDSAVPMPVPGEVFLASAPVNGAALPPNTTVWLRA